MASKQASKQVSKQASKQASLKMASALARLAAPTVEAAHPSRARAARSGIARRRSLACALATALAAVVFVTARSRAERRRSDRSCGAGWGCAARRGRSDHGCSHRGWLGIHRGCSRRGQAAVVAIAEVCMPSLCPSHPIACHSSAQARMPLGARVSVCIPSLCPCHSIACHSSTHATRCARRCACARAPLA